MRRMTSAAALAAALLAVAGCGSDEEGTDSDEEGAGSTAEVNTLTGSVGPGFYIQMAETNVAPGSYTLIVDDQATDHNFHLTGPGVDISTGVAAMPHAEFPLELEAGTYTFVCDPHSSSMKGTLTVG